MKIERRTLKFSMYGASFFVVLGLVWGIIARSQMIKFDAVYSFISLLMSSLSVYAAKSMEKTDELKFPFGKSQMEPLVVVLKSLVILSICILAFARSLQTLLVGGQDVDVFSGMIYAIVGTFLCFLCWLYIRRVGRRKAPSSALLRAESMQWGMDTLLSFAVLVGFLTASILLRLGHEQAARYMDPLMVIVACIFFATFPLKTLIGGVRDILMMAPEEEISSLSREAMEEIAREHGFPDLVFRIGRSGRELGVEVGFVSADPHEKRSMGEMDAIHREVEARLKELFQRPLWLCVSFVNDKSLA
jgi:predicted Co/Zn/Cd cation transporter (cation efflux family)